MENCYYWLILDLLWNWSNKNNMMMHAPVNEIMKFHFFPAKIGWQLLFLFDISQSKAC